MVVGVVEDGALYFIRTDHIGRPVFATDTNGAKVWEASYLPFGGVETSTGDISNLRFPGQWFQSEAGLHQNWMRDYDPTLGRYIQADPLGLVDGASVYGYVLQNPGRYVDPRGERWQHWIFQLLGGGARVDQGPTTTPPPPPTPIIPDFDVPAPPIVLEQCTADDRPACVPDDWISAGGSRSGGGEIFIPPDGRPGCQIRVMPGPPAYCKVICNGTVRDGSGNIIGGPRPSHEPGAHIPESDWPDIPGIFDE